MKEHFSKVNKESFWELCLKLSFVCLCAVMVDCCVTGGGGYVRFGPLSPRMIVGFAAALLALPAIFRDLKGFLKNPVIWLFAAFLVYMAVCAVRGFLAGNRRDVLISDIKGFMWLFLVPVALAAVNSRKRLYTLLSCVIAGAVVQALLIIFIHGLCSVDSIWQHYLYQPFIDLQIGTISYVSERLFRIFTKSSPYMVVGCALLLFRQVRQEKLRLRYVLGIAVCLNGLLLTFTRSVYGCVLVAVVCALVLLAVYFRQQMGKILRFVAAVVCVTVVMVSVQEFIFDTSYFGFAMERSFGTSLSSPGKLLREQVDAWFYVPPQTEWEQLVEQWEQEAEDEKAYWQTVYLEKTDGTDSVREETLSQLHMLMAKAPVFGNGLGACVTNRETGLDEYFYHDMIMRTGAVGLVLYLLPFLWSSFVLLRRKKLAEDASGVLCGMVGFWAVTYFNPWMNAALGIAWYAVFSVLPGLMNEKMISESGE